MAFFGLLKKKKQIFDKNLNNNESKMNTNLDPISSMLASIPDTPSNNCSMNTYDIIVFESEPDGTKKQRQVSGVKAYSKQDLIRLYSADGVEIQIINEYKSNNSIDKNQNKKNINNSPSNSCNIEKDTEKTVEKTIEKTKHMTIQNSCFNNISNNSFQKPQESTKYFEIGGIKCKLENGKMYQEQWVRVNSSKYRIVVDSTNKLSPMTGKHIETLKWVMIDENDYKNLDNGEDEND